MSRHDQNYYQNLLLKYFIRLNNKLFGKYFYNSFNVQRNYLFLEMSSELKKRKFNCSIIPSGVTYKY